MFYPFKCWVSIKKAVCTILMFFGWLGGGSNRWPPVLTESGEDTEIRKRSWKRKMSCGGGGCEELWLGWWLGILGSWVKAPLAAKLTPRGWLKLSSFWGRRNEYQCCSQKDCTWREGVLTDLLNLVLVWCRQWWAEWLPHAHNFLVIPGILDYESTESDACVHNLCHSNSMSF